MRNPVYHVFHRLFGGNDAGLGFVEIVDAAVDRCGFARSGRPGYDDHAAGAVKRIHPESIQHTRQHADIFDLQKFGLPIEKSQHNFLAMNRYKERHPHVHGFAIVLKYQPAALMAPSFGDIGFAHDLEAACDPRNQVQRVILVVVQDAVPAKTDTEPV